MVLTIASLASLVVVLLAGLYKNDATLSGLWYFKIDASKFKSSSSLASGTTGALFGNLVGTATTTKIYDFYQIYFWNYCGGMIVDGKETIQYCSPRQASFVFNPIAQLGLNGTTLQKELPGTVEKAINAYSKATHWMFIVYIIALSVTAASIVVGIFAICSRIGSCVTYIVVSAASFFTVIAALTSTILFSTLVGGLNGGLKEYNIKSFVGTRMLALEWIAVAFSIGASVFWCVSICCCSGKSDRKNRGSAAPAPGFTPFNTARGYQPLGEQTAYGGAHQGESIGLVEKGQAGPYHGRDTAYEPFRHS